jgi:hypothetical protein
MKKVLDLLGGLFVYKSPEPLDGMKTNLRYMTSRELRKLAGTNSHYSKTILINMIVDEMKDRERNT